MKLSSYKDDRVHMWLTVLLILSAVMVVAGVVLMVITYAEKRARNQQVAQTHVEYTIPAPFYVPAMSDLFGGK